MLIRKDEDLDPIKTEIFDAVVGFALSRAVPAVDVEKPFSTSTAGTARDRAAPRGDGALHLSRSGPLVRRLSTKSLDVRNNHYRLSGVG